MRTHPSTAAGLICLLLCSCGTSEEMSQTQRDLRVADVELASGATSAALQIAGSVVAQHPNDAEALIRLASAQSEAGEDEAAENSFRRALHSDCDSLPAQFGLARLHLKSDPAQASQELTELSARAPDNPRVLTDLGVAYDLTARHGEAQAVYRQALALSPGLVSAQVDLGLSLALSNHVDQALAILGPIAQSSDAPPKVRQDYAIAVALAGRTEDAQTILKQDLPTEQVALAIDAFRDLRNSGR